MTGGRHLFAWREALMSPAGPTATRRFVLLVLSLSADTDGGSCFPSTRLLAERTGMSRRRVEGHLREAEAEGWILRAPQGDGQGWRRMSYTLTIPPDVGTEGPHVHPRRGDGVSPASPPDVGTERPHLRREGGDAVARRGDVRDTNVGTERPLTSPYTSQSTSLFDDESSACMSVTDTDDFAPLAKLPSDGRGRIYPPEFEGAFAALPARHVHHPKAATYTAWRARASEVAELFRLEAAADAYREDCERQGRVGSQYVLQGSTFFGPGGRWEPYSGVEPGSLSAPRTETDDFLDREAQRLAHLTAAGGVMLDG